MRYGLALLTALTFVSSDKAIAGPLFTEMPFDLSVIYEGTVNGPDFSGVLIRSDGSRRDFDRRDIPDYFLEPGMQFRFSVDIGKGGRFAVPCDILDVWRYSTCLGFTLGESYKIINSRTGEQSTFFPNIDSDMRGPSINMATGKIDLDLSVTSTAFRGLLDVIFYNEKTDTFRLGTSGCGSFCPMLFDVFTQPTGEGTFSVSRGNIFFDDDQRSRASGIVSFSGRLEGKWTTSIGPSEAPEPTSAALLVTGLAAAACARSARRTRKGSAPRIGPHAC
jgi:hypothetical protein